MRQQKTECSGWHWAGKYIKSANGAVANILKNKTGRQWRGSKYIKNKTGRTQRGSKKTMVQRVAPGKYYIKNIIHRIMKNSHFNAQLEILEKNSNFKEELEL